LRLSQTGRSADAADSTCVAGRYAGLWRRQGVAATDPRRVERSPLYGRATYAQGGAARCDALRGRANHHERQPSTIPVGQSNRQFKADRPNQL